MALRPPLEISYIGMLVFHSALFLLIDFKEWRKEWKGKERKGKERKGREGNKRTN